MKNEIVKNVFAWLSNAWDWTNKNIFHPVADFIVMVLVKIVLRFGIAAGVLVYYLSFAGTPGSYILDDLHLFVIPIASVVFMAMMGFIAGNRIWIYGWMVLVVGYIMFQVSLHSTAILVDIPNLFAEGITIAMFTYAFATIYDMTHAAFVRKEPLLIIGLSSIPFSMESESETPA